MNALDPIRSNPVRRVVLPFPNVPVHRNLHLVLLHGIRIGIVLPRETVPRSKRLIPPLTSSISDIPSIPDDIDEPPVGLGECMIAIPASTQVRAAAAELCA